MWLAFGLLALFVLLTRERTLLDPQSFLRRRYAPLPWLLILHGVPGALGLALGVFQFSTRLRQRYLNLHRWMGRIYVGSALISAPMALVVAYNLPIPTLFMASAIQSAGWIVSAGVGLHCARTGRIQQHREWMMRSYPFAAIFVLNRAVLAIPAIERMGVMGIASVVWSTVALAGVVPSFLIALQNMPKRRPVQVRSTVAAD